MRIRLGVEEDLTRCQQIERAAGEAFRPLGMAAVADDDPPSLEELRRFVKSESLWVATVADELADAHAPGYGAEAAGSPSADPTDPPAWNTAPLCAYLLADPVDGCTHIEQVSVHPAHAGHRIGARLIDHVAASGPGRPLTLTTFANVPWNAPYYQGLGFRVLAQAEVTLGLRRIREHERRLGLDRWPRVCMRREP